MSWQDVSVGTIVNRKWRLKLGKRCCNDCGMCRTTYSQNRCNFALWSALQRPNCWWNVTCFVLEAFKIHGLYTK
jgi:hypothetical protein